MGTNRPRRYIFRFPRSYLELQMRLTYGLTAAVVVAAAGCQAGDTGGTASLETDGQKASYAIGVQVGRNLKPTESHFDMDAFVQGVRDAMADADLALTEDTMMAAAQRMQALVQEEMAREAEVAAERNADEGAAYLAENALKEGVTTTASGLQYEVLRPGEGSMPGPESQVTIHYRGTLIDGTEFDSSYERSEPATFPVGGVIPGFSEGLQLMTVGSHYRFVIPSDIAYGPQGTQGAIGPNATLIFEVELLDLGQ
jgi:FKBP-type peptidyl-prolyl cis-trans isomerase